jgi:flavorubredoxin
MCSYLEEERILFSCDFFGAHIAASDLFVTDRCRVYEAAKRYFGEIMLPFRAIIAKNLEKLGSLEIDLIAPSHGQVYDEPAWILEAYADWALHPPQNLVVLPFVTMHGSTALMVDHLTEALVARGVRVERFNLTVTDIGKLAMALVDAATIVVATPTVLAGPHPLAAYATFLANALRPKAMFLSIIGSYGWGGKTVETLAGMVGNLKAEVLEPVLCKGMPTEAVYAALDRLADTIAAKHREQGLR